ncbi:MAG: metallophosphatase family protein [Candidatus Omnitrophica bacterium]|nr:metallophosphatase family protein [Candidatus Omnitrophota bacterium]
MRYGIFSDVHSNLEALEAVIKAYKKENIDEYFCGGDVVGYAANPSECIKLVREISSFTVAGNHDWATVDLFPVDYFNTEAKEAILWTRDITTEDDKHYLKSLITTYKNNDFTLVHGSPDKPEEFFYITDIKTAENSFKFFEGNICFIGHLHVSGIFVMDKQKHVRYHNSTHIQLEAENKYIVNVGSVGQPRDGNLFACYCIFDSEKKEVWIKRVDYDIKSTYNKIIKAGLPSFLAYRLLLGK